MGKKPTKPHDITLIGMSGVGKSHWSRQLEAAGYELFDCDAKIMRLLKIRLECSEHSYPKTLDAVGRWLGFPYDARYHSKTKEVTLPRKELLLELEGVVMRDVKEMLRDETRTTPVIIDPAGSFLYTCLSNTEALQDLTEIWHLGATDDPQQLLSSEQIEELYNAYVNQSDPKNPTPSKPIIWPRDIYQPNEGEGNIGALKRCFTDLINSRSEGFSRIADQFIPWNKHRDPGMTVDRLFPSLDLEALREQAKPVLPALESLPEIDLQPERPIQPGDQRPQIEP